MFPELLYFCTKFRPSLSHPRVRRTVKYRFLVTPGTGTCSKLLNKQTKKLTEPEQGWFRREPSLELIAYFFGCDHNQLIHQPVKRYFWHVSGYLLLIYNQMLPRQVLVADEILILFYSCRSTKFSSHGCSHGCRVWLSFNVLDLVRLLKFSKTGRSTAMGTARPTTELVQPYKI